MNFTGTAQAHRQFIKETIKKTFVISRKEYAISILQKDVSGISINHQFIEKPISRQQLQTDVKNKYHPIGCDTIKSLLDHEIGHQLTGLLGLDKDSVILSIWNSYKDKTLITQELSEYAWDNGNVNPIGEFIAEALTEYRNNPNCRPLAKKIGTRID
jgi:hypothetical protein